MSSKPALSLVGVSKSYGTVAAVKSISLDVAAGEFLSLLGPSGCGKTTTLSMVAGFESTSAGEIHLNGKRIDHLAPERRDSGMVFQSYALFPHLTVSGNIAFGLKMRGRPRDEIARRVQSAAELVRIDHLLDRNPRQLSGGQQQRVALARALVVEPAILLLDEPFGALDRQLREDLQIELKTLLRRLGMTTIFVTHDQDEALSMSDRVAVMNNGIVEQVDTPKNLYDNPQSRFVAGFIGKANFISGRPSMDSSGHAFVQTAAGKIAAENIRGAGNDEVECFVRPESVRILAPGEASDIRLDASVVETAYFGDHEKVVLDLVDGTRILAVLESQQARHIPDIGSRLEVGWRAGDTTLFQNNVRVG